MSDRDTPATQPDLRGVCVLGVSRSGTSAVAGMFVSVGFFAGRPDDLYPADETNPAGHHENLGIVMENERLMWDLGGTLFGPPPEATDERTRHRHAARIDQELARVLGDAGPAPVVIKDPRIAVLLPLWGELIAARLHPVLAVRHPLEIAHSLARRDGLPVPNALAVWEVHTTALLAYLHGRAVSVAPYADLIGDQSLTHGFVREIVARLDLGRAATLDLAAAGTSARGDLYHHRTGRDGGDYLTDRQRELWRYLSALAPGCQRLEVPLQLRAPSEIAWDAAAAEGRRIVADNELRTEVARRHDRNVELEAELARRHQRNVELEAELVRRHQRNVELEAELVRRHQRNVKLEAELARRGSVRRTRRASPAPSPGDET